MHSSRTAALTFGRIVLLLAAFASAAAPSAKLLAQAPAATAETHARGDITGDWQGTLQAGKSLRAIVRITKSDKGWAAKFFSIGGSKMSLDNIEHGTLRKNYNDPRIHFALVCASISCPRLRNEAYTAAKLEAQLDDQGRDFLNNPSKNKPAKTSAQLSKYFDWYKGDWEKNGQSVPKWVNKYSTVKMDDQATVSYLTYNWNLNEQ